MSIFFDHKSFSRKWLYPCLLASIIFVLFSKLSLAQETAGPTAQDAIFVANNVWMLVATFLVFIMHLGFASLESGLTRSKNTVNILFKNVSIISIGILTYALCGFNLMYPGELGLLPILY